MVLRRRLAVTVLSLCGGAAAGTAFYVLRSRHEVHKPVTTPTIGDMTLKTVQIFFRHGARTPLSNITGLNEVWMSKYFISFRLYALDLKYEFFIRRSIPHPSPFSWLPLSALPPPSYIPSSFLLRPFLSTLPFLAILFHRTPTLNWVGFWYPWARSSAIVTSS